MNTIASPGRGILLFVSAMAIFAVQDGITKNISNLYPPAQILMVRYAVFVLLAALIAGSEAGPWRQMVAVIGDSACHASIGLHAAFGFRRVGIIQSVGFKFGRWVDSVLMQRAIGEGDATPPAG